MKKKFICTILCLILILSGCGRTMNKDQGKFYSFPEAIDQIEIIHKSVFEKIEYTIPATDESKDEAIEAIIDWFDSLDLEECNQPDSVDGNEIYIFIINGETAFTYDCHGSENAFILIKDGYYKANNPSIPPIEKFRRK